MTIKEKNNLIGIRNIYIYARVWFIFARNHRV